MEIACSGSCASTPSRNATAMTKALRRLADYPSATRTGNLCYFTTLLPYLISNSPPISLFSHCFLFDAVWRRVSCFAPTTGHNWRARRTVGASTSARAVTFDYPNASACQESAPVPTLWHHRLRRRRFLSAAAASVLIVAAVAGVSGRLVPELISLSSSRLK